MKRLWILGAAVLVVSGCGSSTSEQTIPSSPAVLSTINSASTSQASDPSSESGGSRSREFGQSPTDKSVREIQTLPGQPPGDPKAEAFLEQLKDIDIQGIEDQLVATADDICRNGQDSVVLGGVAGQIVAQERSSKTAEQIKTILFDTAQKEYCS